VVSAQDKNDAYQNVMEEFAIHYNAKDFKALHDMFDENMKVAVTEANLEQQLTGLHTQAGLIKNVSFIENKNQGKIFKVNHENMILEYAITLDENHKMMGLRPQPYRETAI